MELQANDHFATSNKPPKSIWLTIWTRPRETMRRILDASNNRLQIFILICISLIYCVFDTINRSIIANISSLFITVINSVGCSIVLFFLMTALMYWIGKIIGGRGTYRDIILASLYSAIPSTIFYLLYLLSLLYIYNILPVSGILIDIFILLVIPIFYGWIVIVSLKILAESHRFSSWKAFLIVIISSIPTLIVATYLMI